VKGREKQRLTPQPLLSVCIITQDPNEIIMNFPDWIQLVIGVNGKSDSYHSKVDVSKNGSKLITIGWDKFSFAKVRNTTCQHADGLYTMQLDTDEDFRHWDELKELLENNQDIEAFTVSVISMTQDYELINTRSNRIFKTGYKYWGAVHETIDIDLDSKCAKAVNTALRINHYGYFTDNEGILNKLRRNLKLFEDNYELFQYEYYRKKYVETINKLKEFE